MNKTMNPIGSTPFPEVNVVSIHDCKKNKTFWRGHGHARDCGFGHGRGHDYHSFSIFNKIKKKCSLLELEEKWGETKEKCDALEDHIRIIDFLENGNVEMTKFDGSDN